MGTARNAEPLMALHLTHMPGDPLRGPSWPSFQSDIVRSIILIRSWSSDRWGGLVQGHREAFTLQSQVTKVLGSPVKPLPRLNLRVMVASCVTLSAGLQAHLEPTAVENAALHCCGHQVLLSPYTPHLSLCHRKEMIDINTLQAQTGLGKTYPGLQLANTETWTLHWPSGIKLWLLTCLTANTSVVFLPIAGLHFPAENFLRTLKYLPLGSSSKICSRESKLEQWSFETSSVVLGFLICWKRVCVRNYLTDW